MASLAQPGGPTRRGPSPPGRPLLVVAAHAPELAGLAAALARHRQALTTREVGIGAVESAAGAARVIDDVVPGRIVLVGTAGLYPEARAASRWPVGQVVVVRRSTLASLGVARKSAYLPRLMPTEVKSDPRLCRLLAAAAGLPTGDVACPLGITRTRAAARRLCLATGAQLENLEAFSVARAAAGAGIPFTAVLGISNQVGPRAHRQWRAHGDAAAAAACAAVISLLEAESPSPGRR